MKNRNFHPGIRTLGVSLILFVAVSGCMDRFLRVSVPMPQQEPLPFEQYSRIILGEFTETVEPDDYAPSVHIQDFFTRDVATLIRKPVEHIPELTPESSRLDTLGPALLITGSLKTEFSRRNVIDETRSRYGDRVRTFKDVQNWRMQLDVILINSETRKKVARFSTTRELNGVENTDMEFNYRKLYNQVTDLFINRLTSEERRHDRFLLVE